MAAEGKLLVTGLMGAAKFLKSLSNIGGGGGGGFSVRAQEFYVNNTRVHF